MSRRAVPLGVPRGALEVLGRGTAREAAVELACRGHCEHFRGDAGEDGCAGLSAVASALEGGRLPASALEAVEGEPPPPPRRVVALEEELCRGCSYRVVGCDFASGAGGDASTPCGGYRLLQLLMEKGRIPRGGGA